MRYPASEKLDNHLDSQAQEGRTNRRNGTSQKTVLTGTSRLTLDIPRDREGRFDPKLSAKYQRRFPDFDAKIISMYARGMTVREIRGHLEELYGVDVSPDLISTVPDTVLETVAEWQGRPLDTCYPLVFFDATYSSGWRMFDSVNLKIGDQLVSRKLDIISRDVVTCSYGPCVHSEILGIPLEETEVEALVASPATGLLQFRLKSRNGLDWDDDIAVAEIVGAYRKVSDYRDSLGGD